MSGPEVSEWRKDAHTLNKRLESKASLKRLAQRSDQRFRTQSGAQPTVGRLVSRRFASTPAKIFSALDNNCRLEDSCTVNSGAEQSVKLITRLVH